MKKFALIGQNIANSLSPFIHGIIYRELNESAIYTLSDASPADVFGLDLDGFNVTRPYKTDIVPFLKNLQKPCLSVNTVTRDKIGYSTDGDGFILDAERLFLDLSKVLVYGTGGAARSILYSLLNDEVNADICGRSFEKAADIAKNINLYCSKRKVAAKEIGKIKEEKYSLVIDCTDSVNRLEIAAKSYYDIKYLGQEGLGKDFNGLGMLIYQAILSDEIFLGVKIDKRAMFNVVYKELLSKRQNLKDKSNLLQKY